MTDDDEWARGMFAAINIRERIDAYLGHAEEIVTREPCPGCPFAGCDRCEWQGGVSAGETACLPLDLGGGEGKMEDVSDPRERRNSGGLAGTYVGGPTG